MTTVPVTPAPDDKDWTWVITRPCDECGFDASAMDRADGPRLIREAAGDLGAAALRDDARTRPAPTVWSPLEYACHARDACRIYLERVRLMLTEHDPTFADWDQDETAVAERYWEQDPAQVAALLDRAAGRLAEAFAAVAGDQWRRPGRRSNGSVFTVDTLSRYFVHDLVHHVHDVT